MLTEIENAFSAIDLAEDLTWEVIERHVEDRNLSSLLIATEKLQNLARARRALDKMLDVVSAS